MAEEEVRILFVGNSYTGGIRKAFSKLVAASPEGSAVKIEYISPGGRTLASHLKNPSVTQKITDGKWDFVVLQDQSQTPAVFPDKFKNDTFAPPLKVFIRPHDLHGIPQCIMS